MGITNIKSGGFILDCEVRKSLSVAKISEHGEINELEFKSWFQKLQIMNISTRTFFKYIIALTNVEFLLLVMMVAFISYTDQFYTEWFNVKFPITPMTIPIMFATLLTLILAFRVNQAYNRWWEARTVWGKITNDTLSLMRQVSHFRESSSNSKNAVVFRNTLVDYCVAWSYALVSMLLNRQEIAQRIEPRLDVNDFEKIDFDKDHIPGTILFFMYEKVQMAYHDGTLNAYQQVAICEKINDLGDAMGMVSRIKHTQFPRIYSFLIHLILWVFLFLLPLAYRDPNEYFEFPVILVISIVFFYLEAFAKDLQDPFENRPTDVPILKITEKIESIADRHVAHAMDE